MSAEAELLELLRQDGIKPRLAIVRCSCMCGGNWAWAFKLRDGSHYMIGCVCHHWWTLALRAGAETQKETT